MYSVVVPVYNSEKSLGELYGRLSDMFQKEKESFELVLVDDSSKDRSYQVMKQLKNDNTNVTIIQMARNFGQHKATLCGMKYAKGEFIITMDDDLQHPPEEIPKLIKTMKENENIDVVIGMYDTKKHNLIRNFGTMCTNKLTSIIFHKDSNLKLTSFRLMRRNIVEGLLSFNLKNPRIGHMLLQISNKIVDVQIHHDTRQYGKSGYSFRKLIKDFINNILNNSDLPLKILGGVGMLSFLISILLALYYICNYLIHGVKVAGWTTLVVLILLFSGIILFSIGLIGNYMIRILNETKESPAYVIRNIELNEEK